VLKKTLIVLVLLAGIFLILTYPKIYVIRGSGGGTLYWNANEALLFMGGGSDGARMSYLRYAFEPILVALRILRFPDDERCSQPLVIRVTDKEVQRHEVDLYGHAEELSCGYDLAPFQGRIYAGHLAQDKLFKWSGNQFEPATPDEVRAFHASRANAKPDPHPWEFDNVDNVDGWSMRALGQTPPPYELTLNGQPVTLVFSGETWPPKPLSVDLIRPGQAAQRIWTFDGRPHRVSRAEYEHTFGQH
jgi:hypothetical protein